MISKPAWLTSEVGINKGMKTHFQPRKTVRFKRKKKHTFNQEKKENKTRS